MAESKEPRLLKDSRGYRLEKKTFDKFKLKFDSVPTPDASFPVPSFASVVDEELATILVARWHEAHKTFRAEAYLSTIILLGSILEGILLAKVKANPKEANTSGVSPKNPSGKVLPLKDWSLESLISVSHACGWLDKDVKDFSSALRSYRNLVHPNRQLAEQIYPTAETCRISWAVLNAALSHVSR